MKTVTLSIRIRRELRERMRRLKGLDWRAEIERFIEGGLGRLSFQRF